MPTQTQTDQSKPNFGTLYAKCLCISFPGHELNLIKELDNLARSERISRSQYIRKVIREQMDQRKATSTTNWRSN
jgi:metal-responsive CopG/Arc/MetJ family transcriptional regulator